jgi:signal peptidase I
MPRLRMLYAVSVLTVLVLAPNAGCAALGGITADSTCGDYLSAPTDERHAAAASLSTDLDAFSAGNPLWGTSLDAECGATPETTLRSYFAGQLALEVPSVSMANTIDSGDTILVNTLAYTREAPRRGEVVVFTAPESWRATPAEERFVKRVIGTGGDHVVCCDADHRLQVNGLPLDEQYLYRDDSGPSDPPATDAFDIVVPDGRLWVMGDHRSASGDSLMHFARIGDIEQATIPVDAMVGRAFAVVGPQDQDEIRWLTVPPTYAKVPDAVPTA